MPGRKYEAQSGYRYGFNGQESSSEISQNTTSALFWEYDSKISRRWNTDPKPNPGVSLYSCFNGSPIQKVDILGDTTRPYFSATRYTRDFKTEITADNTFTFKEAGVKFRAAAYSTKLFDKDYLGYFRPRTIYLVEDKTVINENDIIVGDGTVIRTKGTNWVYWMHSNEGSQASKVTNSLCRATGTTVFAMAFGGTALPAAPSLLSYSTPTLKLGLIKFGVGSTADVLAQTAGNPKQPINWWSAGVNGLGAAFNLNPFTTAAAASSFKRESSGDYSLNNFDNFFWNTMNNGISGHLLNTGGFNPAKFDKAKDVSAMHVFNLLPSFWGNAASNVATDYLVPEK